MELTYNAPLRLSLAGGGTDLPECYLKSGAHVLSVTLNLNIKVKVGKNIEHQSTELNDLFQQFHPEFNVNTYSDVSPGAGLGGSGAVAVGLAAASHYISNGNSGIPLDIGLTAYQWEREQLKLTVGFQDQLASAVGGCVEMKANTDGKIDAFQREDLLEGLNYLFENNFVLVETGVRRNANDILKQLGDSFDVDTTNARPATVEEVEEAILTKDGLLFGEILKNHWASKVKRLPAATNSTIDSIIRISLNAGATGAKAIGAGAGGFILISGPSEVRQNIIDQLKLNQFTVVEASVSSKGVEQLINN